MNANNILPNATHANNASTITDTLWDGYQRSLNSGARALIELPMQLKSVIGSDGIQVLADRLRDFIQAPISVSDVVSRSVVKIEPAKLPKRYVRGLPRRKLSTTKAKDPDRILRPPNSWILYRKHHHRLIKARDPAKLNNDISKEISLLWQNESPEVRQQFQELSDRLKAEHKEKYPNYVYNPRRPWQKKRRMTQRKREALATVKQQEEGSVAESSTNAQVSVQATEFELPRTPFGNIVLELGEDSLDENALASALNNWNANLAPTSNQVGDILTQATSPVLYNQPTEGTHDQQQFVDALVKFTKCGPCDLPDMMDDDFDEDDMEWDDLAQQEINFDEENSLNFEAELQRMSRI